MTNPKTDTSHLSVLVNTDRIRSSIKRLFHNNVAETLAELFQNSQRAGAKNVTIKITPDGFSVTDDGHGLLNGVDGFHTLLKLAESQFDNPTIEDQDPMGVGIVSLLTHDAVEEVIFTSGKLRLSLDPARWWSDENYYSTWFQRLRKLRKPVAGLSIYVRCKATMIGELRKALEAKDGVRLFSSDTIFDISSPAQGYEGILNITLDGKPVRTSLPMWARFNHPLVTTTYQGAKLTIGYDPEATTRRSSMLWYGQLILVKNPHSRFKFHLEVKSGKPVNPLSPTRAGVIEDAAYHELLAFVKDQVFAFICNTQNRSRITASIIEECFSYDSERAKSQLPYITTRPILPLNNPSSIDGCEQVGELEFFTYDEAPLLLDQEVHIVQNNETLTAEYGLSSFAPLLKNPHIVRYGDANRLQVGRLYWKPGKLTTKPWFHQPGVFGISFVSEQPPAQWNRVTKGPVFTFTEASSYCVSDVDFVVGTTADPIDFLHNESWAAFSPSDESDYDPQQIDFEESVDEVIRSIIGKCVPRDFKIHDITHFLKDKTALVTQIKFVYPKGTLTRAGKLKTHNPPSHITAVSNKNQRVRLRLY